jgi:predicted HicB family RNase H-like nuclease
MEKEFKKRKVVVRITESQFKRLTSNLIDEEKSISQFIREAIKEKLKKKK